MHQIYDLSTLKAAREEDLRVCGLKMGEIIKLRTLVYSPDGESSNNDEFEDRSTSSSLESSLLSNSPLNEEEVAGQTCTPVQVLYTALQGVQLSE